LENGGVSPNEAINTARDLFKNEKIRGIRLMGLYLKLADRPGDAMRS